MNRDKLDIINTHTTAVQPWYRHIN